MLFANSGMSQDVPIQQWITAVRIEQWLQEDIFQIRWWILISFFVFSVIVWWKLVDKTRLPEIMLFAGITMIASLILDEFGEELTMWDYPTDIFPLFPPLTDVNIASDREFTRDFTSIIRHGEPFSRQLSSCPPYFPLSWSLSSFGAAFTKSLSGVIFTASQFTSYWRCLSAGWLSASMPLRKNTTGIAKLDKVFASKLKGHLCSMRKDVLLFSK